MADKLKLEIVTPRGRALSLAVEEVTVPGVYGEVGVLPGHVPLLSALRPGIVSYREGGETHRAAIGPGFAEAGPDKMTILAEDYAQRDQIDPVLVRKDLAEVQERLAKLEGVTVAGPDARGANADEVDARAKREVLIARENWLAVELELYGDPPPATQRPYEEFGPPSPFADDEIPVPDDSK